MSTELSARVVLQDGLHFVGSDAAGHTVNMDSTPSAGGGKGPTPMDLILIGLAGCSAMDVITILRKKRQPVAGLEVAVTGQRREDQPTVFTSIDLTYLVHGADVDPRAVERAIELSKQVYCPVWAMLSHSVQIDSSFRILSEVPQLEPVL
jgi:putative redox protein